MFTWATWYKVRNKLINALLRPFKSFLKDRLSWKRSRILPRRGSIFIHVYICHKTNPEILDQRERYTVTLYKAGKGLWTQLEIQRLLSAGVWSRALEGENLLAATHGRKHSSEPHWPQQSFHQTARLAKSNHFMTSSLLPSYHSSLSPPQNTHFEVYSVSRFYPYIKKKSRLF